MTIFTAIVWIISVGHSVTAELTLDVSSLELFIPQNTKTELHCVWEAGGEDRAEIGIFRGRTQYAAFLQLPGRCAVLYAKPGYLARCENDTMLRWAARKTYTLVIPSMLIDEYQQWYCQNPNLNLRSDTLHLEDRLCAVQCQNGGIFRREPCECECINHWTGDNCGLCGISDCGNNGTVNRGPCRCHCDKHWHGDRCEKCLLECKHGGILRKEDCRCDCKGNWTGDTCERCSLRRCGKGGSVDLVRCRCSCGEHWYGDNCDKCNLTCGHDGYFEEEDCDCDCKGLWTGDMCEKCRIQKCVNGGMFQREICKCNCSDNWSGDTCEICSSEVHCENGGTLHNDTCRCKCQKHFIGRTCGVCSLECQNSAILQRDCKCFCSDAWSGEKCELKSGLYPGAEQATGGLNQGVFAVIAIMLLLAPVAVFLVWIVYRRHTGFKTDEEEFKVVKINQSDKNESTRLSRQPAN